MVSVGVTFCVVCDAIGTTKNSCVSSQPSTTLFTHITFDVSKERKRKTKSMKEQEREKESQMKNGLPDAATYPY